MILVTVGTQLGFDRLIEVMDKLAPDLSEPILAQSGNGTYRAKNFEQRVEIAPYEFETLIKNTKLIVSHAGVGTVLTAARLKKPIVLFPRRASLGEHRNDHQLATCRQLKGRSGILTAFDEADLSGAIAQGLASDQISVPLPRPTPELQAAILSFIEKGEI